MNSDTHYDLILKNGKVVLPEGTAEVNIGIKNEKIQEIGSLANTSAEEIID